MTLRPSSAAAPPGTGRALALAFAAFALLQLTLAVVWVVPGPLSVDEVLYEWMTRNAAEGRPLHVANGYEETPSPELTPERFVRTEGGRLTVQYPVLWSMTAAPLYRAFGYRALFLLNALALAGVMLFTWRIGLRLLGSAPAALAGCLLLGAGTYAWEYSVAAWPHMATLLLQVAAFDTVLEAREAKGRRAFVAALVAGGLAGLAVGFRRDAVFLLPVLALLLLWERPLRWRALAGLALGAAAPLLLLAWLNALRWGVWSPLSYGRAEPRYRVVGVVGLAGFVGLALLGRADARRALLRRWRPVVLAGAAAYLALLLVPATAERALTAARGVENVLVDLRGAPSDTGRYYWAVIWFGGVKKSLLQSLPWLPLLALPVWRAWRTPGRRAALVTLLLPVAVYAGVPALLDRHGGMSLNLRYLLPGLPFLALLGAWAALEVAGAVRSRSESRRAALGAGGAGVLAAAAGWAWLAPRDFVSREAETAVLDAPLVLAGLAAAAVTWWILRAGRGAGGRGGGGRGGQGGGAGGGASREGGRRHPPPSSSSGPRR